MKKMQEWNERDNKIRNININYIFKVTIYFKVVIERMYDKVFKIIHNHMETKRVVILILTK
jgi:hypothetical protein